MDQYRNPHCRIQLLCTWSPRYWNGVLARYLGVMWYLFGFVSPTKRERVNKMERWTERLIATVFLDHVSSAIVIVAKTQWLLLQPVKMSLLMIWVTPLMQLMCCSYGVWYPAQVNSVPVKSQDGRMANCSSSAIRSRREEEKHTELMLNSTSV